MVRREKSPEINEDIRLFVVWIPYPLNPNWVFEQDVQDCAKWVAEVIGNEFYLISIHQKPSSRGMILLEISKEFTDHKRLLGEHQWRHFLKDPTKDEEGHKTCVYYSVYRTCRDARKEGWNPIPTPTKWFKDWSPGTGRIVSPYPEPKHCPPPPENRTSKQICRHIPLSTKQASIPTKSPIVVGSSAWIAQQKQEVPNLDDTPVEDKTTASTPKGETSSKPVPPKSKSKAVPLQKFMSQSDVPPQKKPQAPTWVNRSLSSSSVPQPIAEPPKKPQNAWSQPLKIAPLKPAKTNTDSKEETWNSHNSWADLVEHESSTNPSYVASDEEDDFLAAMEHPSNDGSTTLPNNEPSGESGNSNDWGKVTAWSDTEEDPEKKTQEILCPTHGPACSKKICQDYNKLERDRKREEAKKNGQWRGRGRGRGRGHNRFFKAEVN